MPTRAELATYAGIGARFALIGAGVQRNGDTGTTLLTLVLAPPHSENNTHLVNVVLPDDQLADLMRMFAPAANPH